MFTVGVKTLRSAGIIIMYSLTMVLKIRVSEMCTRNMQQVFSSTNHALQYFVQKQIILLQRHARVFGYLIKIVISDQYCIEALLARMCGNFILFYYCAYEECLQDLC